MRQRPRAVPDRRPEGAGGNLDGQRRPAIEGGVELAPGGLANRSLTHKLSVSFPDNRLPRLEPDSKRLRARRSFQFSDHAGIYCAHNEPRAASMSA